MRWTEDGLASAGTVFGFPVFVHATVLALAPGASVIAVLGNSSTNGLLGSLALLPIVLASVLAHELGHAFAARSLGVPVRHIALTWFGGYAAFWVKPTRWREAVISFAGPAVNLALAAALFAILTGLPASGTAPIFDGFLIASRPEPSPLEVIVRMALFVNLGLGAFNLLPGLPLDGGHILRAALTIRMSRGRASWLAAWAGVAIGVLVILYAYWVENIWSLAIGIFVVTTAWLEKKALRYD